MKDRLTDAAINQGYTPDGAETNSARQTDHKESYEHRRFNNDRCPPDEEMQGFRNFMDGFYEVSQGVQAESVRILTPTRNSTRFLFMSSVLLR